MSWFRKSPETTPDVVWPRDNVSDTHAQVSAAVTWAMSLAPDQVWNTQPYVRTVVTFLARNIAQLGLHCFTRIDATQRERVQDDPLAMTIRYPNPNTTTYELIFGLVADKALYDRAYWYIGSGKNGAKTLTRIPPSRVVAHIATDPLGTIDAFRVQTVRGMPVDVPASKVLYFPGWNPTSAVGLPSSPIDAIKSIIGEQAASFEFRKLAWSNGLQTSQTIERPAGVPWKPEQRDKFVEDARAQFSGTGPRRNGVLLLEDGMQLKGEQFSAREAQWIDAAKLSLALVASVYHVNPTMVGLLENANYSNVVEFRKMLYGDTLGPIIADVEGRLNTFLVPMLAGDDSEYVEFNIAEKLQGSFAEQTQALQTAVGAPWMLRSEARAVLNLPPIDGADELVVPLNLGQEASPDTSASSPSNAPPAGASASFPHAALHSAAASPPALASVTQLKRAVSSAQQQRVDDVLVSYFGKQQAVVLSRIGAGDPDWWDGKRWDKLLAGDLHAVALELSTITGKSEAARLGYHPNDYDPAQTLNYIAAVAERFAGNINGTTKQQLDQELADKDEGDPSDVFTKATTSRGPGIGTMVATFAVGFACAEVGRQLAQRYRVSPTKTWVTGPNPRGTHADMNGETVGVDEAFSNGMDHPADSGDADEVAGCNCSLDINIG